MLNARAARCWTSRCPVQAPTSKAGGLSLCILSSTWYDPSVQVSFPAGYLATSCWSFRLCFPDDWQPWLPFQCSHCLVGCSFVHLWLIREYTFPLKKAMMTWWIDVSNSDDTLFFSSMILFVFCPRSLCLPLGFEYGLLWTETKRMCLSQLTFYCFLFPIYVIFSLLFCTFLMSTTKTFYCIS